MVWGMSILAAFLIALVLGWYRAPREQALRAFVWGALWVSVAGFYVGRMLRWMEYEPTWYWVGTAFICLAFGAALFFEGMRYHRRSLPEYRKITFAIACLTVVLSFAAGSWTAGTLLDLAGRKALADSKKLVLNAGYFLEPSKPLVDSSDQRHPAFWIGKALRAPSAVSLGVGDGIAATVEKPFLRWNSETSFLADFRKAAAKGNLPLDMKKAAKSLVQRHEEVFGYLEKAQALRSRESQPDPRVFDENVKAFGSSSKLISLSRIVLCRAVVRSDDGNETGALADMRLARFLAESSDAGNGVVGLMVGAAIQRMTLGVFKGFILPRTGGECLRTGLLPSFDEKKEREAMWADFEYDAFYYQREAELKVFGPWREYRTTFDDGMPTWMAVAFRSLFLWTLRFDYAAMYRNHLAQIQSLRVPYTRLDAACDETERDYRRTTWLLGSIAHSDPRGIYKKAMETVAETRLAGLAIRLKAYKEKTGRWPDRLEDLSDVSTEGKIDPFTDNHEFIYRPMKQGVMLYSVGPDGIDDGGRERAPGSQTDKGCDLVWNFC